MKKKVLLLGKSGAGKTSMRSIIFANFIARDTMRLGATINVEHSHVRFLGDLVLNLWDCGGQEAFMENYFASQRDHIFRNVEVLIYIFDVESRESQKDLHYYHSCLEALQQYSPEAKVFCLIHKMDLKPEDQRAQIFQAKTAEVERLSAGTTVTCYPTSIWDETLYRAWSSIVYSLIPNVQRLEQNLIKFCDILEADEVVLFEKATFLVIAHALRKEHHDVHRFEKISNIVKHFKLSCARAQNQFESLDVKNANFAAFISTFTPNTYVLVVSTNTAIEPVSIKMNIEAASAHFQSISQSLE
eukprot:GCRY01004186.1.p1 GENE.GCRY01004186.1~~GCRY01004186.1.p1  ORF type:complete len:301 (+),score=83.51 GCRY01004186.1:177-1079(+)